MPDISVVVITFNEEKNIERCLRSVEGIADEVVVVDSFSTDKTVAMCETMGARVVRHAFEGYTQQKNWAIAQARFSHVLSLDADEALSPGLAQSIRTVKDAWQCDGYEFNRLTNYCGTWIRHTDWYPDRKLRLWDRRKGSWQGDNPHDFFQLNPGGSTGFLKGDLYHYSYVTIRQHIEQLNHFTDITAREAFKKGRKAGYADLLLRPVWKFFKSYIFRLGFLDGYHGFVVCLVSAFATFVKYAKLRQLARDGKAKPA
jgi:glycosyltransferase involved in cell wall biosynthesis